jgi:leucyl aminopeptidase
MSETTPHAANDRGDALQSLQQPCAVTAVADVDPAACDAVAFLVAKERELPQGLGLSVDAAVAAGFDFSAASTLVIPTDTVPVVLVGLGALDEVTVDGLRDAAAAAARATSRFAERLTLSVDSDLDVQFVGGALAEGARLARYRYRTLTADSKAKELTELGLHVAGADVGEVQGGADAAVPAIRAALVARDLANTPAGMLSASDMAEVAQALGEEHGFEVEVHDKASLLELGCGGLLGVNAGSTEEPRMVILRYIPAGEPRSHLGLVGKGIMYDSGGISLKPSDPMHLLMKIDMGGAAAVLGAFTAFAQMGVESRVTGWLMCTDNMPSGTATKLGDVLVARNGTTVEVKNTDAEGRLVMMDALALAVEEGVDAIVDIATLTGAAMMALGKSRAALFGTDDALVAAVEEAAAAVDEPVWRMPLEKRYRKQLDSQIADIANLGGPHAGATTAALFLHEFVGETPWAHLDIAGTMETEKDDSWRSAGATGFGARLLATVARSHGE